MMHQRGPTMMHQIEYHPYLHMLFLALAGLAMKPCPRGDMAHDRIGAKVRDSAKIRDSVSRAHHGHVVGTWPVLSRISIIVIMFSALWGHPITLAAALVVVCHVPRAARLLIRSIGFMAMQGRASQQIPRLGVRDWS